MFSKLQSLLAKTLEEVVQPQPAKSKLDSFRDHWQYIVHYFESHRKELASSVWETNIPFHMDVMVKYIKEEIMSAQETMNEEESSMTGECLEELLQRRMLEVMVGWGEMDTPPGMRITVLKTYSLLVSNIHHRLLPEGSVRLPLNRLIKFCHELDDSADNGHDTTQMELIKLIDVIFRQMEANPALLNLFIEDTPEKSMKFPLFTYLFDYISLPNVQVSTVAREALTIGVRLLCSDSSLTQFAIKHSKIGAVMAQKLILLYSMMPTDLTLNDSMPLSPSSQSVNATDADGYAANRSIVDFYDFCAFVDNVLRATSMPIHPRVYRDSSPKRHAKTISPYGQELHSNIVHTVHSIFFQQFLFKKLVTGESENECIMNMGYFCQIFNRIGDESLVELVIGSLLTAECDLGHSAVGTFSDMLMKRAASKSEKTSLAALKLIDAMLDTYNYAVYNRFVLCDLPEVTTMIDSVIVTDVRDELLKLSIMDDGSLPSPQYSPSHDSNRPASPYQEDDGYFIEAETRSEKCMHARKKWPNDPHEVDSVNFLDFILSQFKTYFTSNTPRTNLLLTGIVSKIAHLPNESLQNWLLSPDNPNGFRACLKETIDAAATLIAGLDEAKLKIIRKYCGNDLIAIFHNLSQASLSTANTAEEKATKQSDIAISSSYSSYLILVEFGKELVSVLLVLHRSLGIQQEVAELSFRDLNDTAAEPFPSDVELTAP